LQIDDASLKMFPNIKIELIKLFYILKGVVSGLSNSNTLSIFFDWLYPDNYQLVEKALRVFIEDDEIVLVIFKFLSELVYNRCSRLKFEEWNIDGLFIFKEASKICI
jgi:hypothetical protein